MKLLVIGGSYFTGRVFTLKASQAGHSLTLLNRGKYTMTAQGEHIKEFKCDRHDADTMKHLELESEYDAVIDFCAYEPGDISQVVESLPCSFRQYVYISTADVYERAEGSKMEDAPLHTTEPPADDMVNMYTYKKMLLEKELLEECDNKDFCYTIMRPAFIYGPYNYAPRESWYFRYIMNDMDVYVPETSTAKFQMIYVGDIAQAILASIGNEAAEDEAFNLSAPELFDYDYFLEVIAKVSGKQIRQVPLTREQIIEHQVPLPFPIEEPESELFDGSKAERVLGLSYTPAETGMARTYEAFRPVFERI